MSLFSRKIRQIFQKIFLLIFFHPAKVFNRVYIYIFNNNNKIKKKKKNTHAFIDSWQETFFVKTLYLQVHNYNDWIMFLLAYGPKTPLLMVLFFFSSELFTTVLDMLNCLVLGALVPDPAEKNDDTKKIHGNLVKKLRVSNYSIIIQYFLCPIIFNDADGGGGGGHIVSALSICTSVSSVPSVRM